MEQQSQQAKGTTKKGRKEKQQSFVAKMEGSALGDVWRAQKKQSHLTAWRASMQPLGPFPHFEVAPKAG